MAKGYPSKNILPIRELIRKSNGITARELKDFFDGIIPAGSIRSRLWLDMDAGFIVRDSNNKLWLTEKGHESLLPAPTPCQPSQPVEPTIPAPEKNGNGSDASEKIVGQYRTVNLQLLVKYSDLLLASILDEIKDFAEVVDARSTSVCATNPEDVVVAVRFKR